MFDGVTMIPDGLCDFCSNTSVISARAEAKVPDVMQDCRYVGGPTPEKSRRWRDAICESERELRKTCYRFATADCDGGTICESCLRQLLHSGPFEPLRS